MNNINQKIIRNCQEPHSAGRITKNQPNALTPALHDLKIVWFRFFTVLNNIDQIKYLRY